MGKQSFFAEKRSANNNPNFFNFMPVDEIRKSVKRIIKDIKFDNILDQDYVYFSNPAVISACITESYMQYISASVIVNALNYYINDGLNNGFMPNKTINIEIERRNAVSEQMRQNTRAYAWGYIYSLFVLIKDGKAEIKPTLENIRLLDINVNAL